jgi:hypothetical protein
MKRRRHPPHKGRATMWQKIVGTYRLGDEMVQLVLREGGGADFYERPGDIPYPRMKVGADQPAVGWLMDSVMHEAQERSMAVMRLRFQRTDSYYVDSTAWIFVLTHEEFTESCHRAGMFLGECLPDLRRAWAAWKKQKP